MQKSRAPIQKKWIYYIEERRREVAQMLAQGHSETEIAQLLGVHVSTICRDVKVLKQLSQRFVFDLAKGDLTYHYKQCIDEIEEVRRAAWTLYRHGRFTERIILSTKEQIMALKLAKQYTVISISLQEQHLHLDI
jgi:IS30 family transposase